MTMKKLALFLFISVALVACTQEDRSSTNIGDTSSRMSVLIEQHRFEEAAQFGLHALTGKPADATTYYFVTLAYAERAQYEVDTRGISLKFVDEYSRKSLSFDPDNQLNRFNVAWVLEYAGDVEANSRCKYYAESQEVLNQASSKLSADAVLKHEVDVSTSRVIQKLKAGHCQ